MSKPPSDLIGGNEKPTPPSDLISSDAGVPSPMSPEEIQISPGERIKEVGKATGIGAIGGAIAPELTSLAGLGLMAFPPTAPFGPPVIATGRAMRGARIASTTAGALGGLVGETGGQVVEAKGGKPATAEAARFIGGMVGPEVAGLVTKPLTSVGGYALSTVMNKLSPGLGTSARTLGQLLGERGVREGLPNLTQEQQLFIQNKLRAIRGGPESFQSMKDIMGILRQAAQREVSSADVLAGSLEAQAQAELQRATAAGAVMTQDALQRISRLQSQLNSAADSIRTKSEQQANIILAQAEASARNVMSRAAQQTPEVQRAAQAEAEAIVQAGRQQADQIAAQSKQRMNRLQQTSDRLRQSIPGRAQAAGAEIAAVGPTATPTELGNQIRKGFDDQFQKLRAAREANVDKFKNEAFAGALQKEQAGRTFRETPEYREALIGISREIENPQTKLLNVPEGAVRQGLVNVLSQLQTEKLSFQGLEVLRRSLRDRASGLPAEGYDAIGQQQAGRLADYIENIQKGFSPGFGRYLQQYKIDSAPLNQFKSKLGEAMVGKADFDFTQFAADPATLAGQAFKTQSTVNQLLQTVGPQQAEGFARAYVADLIRGGKSTDVRAAIDKSRDWINQFPALAQQLNLAAERVGIAERVGAKRSTLAKQLRTEMGAIPVEMGRKMTRAEEDAAKEAAKRLGIAEKEVAGITTAAEREAGTVMTEAQRAAEKTAAEAEKQIAASAKKVEGRVGEIRAGAEKGAAAELTAAEKVAGGLTKQAQEIRKQAEDKAKLILAGKTPVERVQGFLLGSNDQEWQVLSDIIKSSPGGVERLSEAVAQTIAFRADQSLKGAIRDMKLMGDKLVSNGLMPQAKVDSLVRQLEDVFVAPIDTVTRTTLTQRLIRNAFAGYAVPGVVRGGEAAYKSLTE